MRNTVKALFHVLLASSLLAAGGVWAAPGRAAMAGGQIGTQKFEVHGARGRPVILMPGLEGGPWVWKDTIPKLEKNRVVHAVTLAGFDGMPAPARRTGLIEQADASLALRFAGEYAKLVSGAVAVDGLPVFPGMDRVSAERRQAIAGRARTRMATMTPAQYQAAVLYQGLPADAPHAKVVSIASARYFVMLDQPVRFQQVLNDSLQAL